MRNLRHVYPAIDSESSWYVTADTFWCVGLGIGVHRTAFPLGSCWEIWIVAGVAGVSVNFWWNVL